jgi:hypothetical protein
MLLHRGASAPVHMLVRFLQVAAAGDPDCGALLVFRFALE